MQIKKTERHSSRKELGSLGNLTLSLLYNYLLILCSIIIHFPFEGSILFLFITVPFSFQIIPYFVMHILADFPGLAGLFIAVLFSGSLRYTDIIIQNIRILHKKAENP